LVQSSSAGRFFAFGLFVRECPSSLPAALVDRTNSKSRRRDPKTDGFAFVPKPLPCTSEDIGVVPNQQPHIVCATSGMLPD
jgi:hypothetical protein